MPLQEKGDAAKAGGFEKAGRAMLSRRAIPIES